MMTPIPRRASRLICDLLLAALPRHGKPWAEAICAEVEHIPEHGAAFLFALDALRGVALQVLAHAPFAVLAAVRQMYAGRSMGIARLLGSAPGPARHLFLSLACAVGAVGLGLSYLLAADAPFSMLAVNAGALVLGLAILSLLSCMPAATAFGSAVATLVMSCALLLTAFYGTSAEGASRWVTLGPLVCQPSLILLPLIIHVFAHDRGPISACAVLVAGLAMALQPDRAMAGVLVCGLLPSVIARRDRFGVTTLAASAMAFIAAMTQPDRLAAAPYVDRVLSTAYSVHALAGLAVTVGAAILLVPALYGLLSRSVDSRSCVTFGAVWLSIVMASALANTPTPVVGYGGSAILGYLFSLGSLLSGSTRNRALPCGRSGPGEEPEKTFYPYVRHHHA